MSFYIAITCRRHRAVHELSSEQYAFVLQQGERCRTQRIFSRSFPSVKISRAWPLPYYSTPFTNTIWYDSMIFFCDIYNTCTAMHIRPYDMLEYCTRYAFFKTTSPSTFLCLCIGISCGADELPGHFLGGVVHWRCNSAWWLAWCSWSPLEQVVTSKDMRTLRSYQKLPEKLLFLGGSWMILDTWLRFRWSDCSLGILEHVSWLA